MLASSGSCSGGVALAAAWRAASGGCGVTDGRVLVAACWPGRAGEGGRGAAGSAAALGGCKRRGGGLQSVQGLVQVNDLGTAALTRGDLFGEVQGCCRGPATVVGEEAEAMISGSVASYVAGEGHCLRGGGPLSVRVGGSRVLDAGGLMRRKRRCYHSGGRGLWGRGAACSRPVGCYWCGTGGLFSGRGRQLAGGKPLFARCIAAALGWAPATEARAGADCGRCMMALASHFELIPPIRGVPHRSEITSTS